jgi:hypothetical protein
MMDTTKGEQGCIWKMYFVSIYENRRMKPPKIVLRRRRGDDGE